MQIKVYVIDVTLPRWVRKLGIYGGIPAALLLGSSALVRADVTLPHSFSSGETLTAADLNANFEALANAINDGNCPKGFTYDGSEPPYIVCTRTFNSATDEMVKVGDFWVDRYEASWCGGGSLGNENGSNATAAVCSAAGATPLGSATWFQAVATCTNAGKHLCTNAQWQAAVSGTPDPGSYPDLNSTNGWNDAPPSASTAAVSRCQLPMPGLRTW